MEERGEPDTSLGEGDGGVGSPAWEHRELGQG